MHDFTQHPRQQSPRLRRSFRRRQIWKHVFQGRRSIQRPDRDEHRRGGLFSNAISPEHHRLCYPHEVSSPSPHGNPDARAICSGIQKLPPRIRRHLPHSQDQGGRCVHSWRLRRREETSVHSRVPHDTCQRLLLGQLNKRPGRQHRPRVHQSHPGDDGRSWTLHNCHIVSGRQWNL